jgi:hypothetical protein
MKRLILVLAAAALTACATSPAAVAGPTAGLGGIAAVDGLRIRPLRVIEDSRCPINARCVWAGRMILQAEVRSAGGSSTYDLALGEPVAHDGGRLALVAAEPGRIAGSETDQAVYRFTFEFTPR